MARKELSQDRYFEGSDYWEEYLEGRETYMAGDTDNPYRHQPHDAGKAEAWRCGREDEKIWALDSTGR